MTEYEKLVLRLATKNLRGAVDAMQQEPDDLKRRADCFRMIKETADQLDQLAAISE